MGQLGPHERCSVKIEKEKEARRSIRSSPIKVGLLLASVPRRCDLAGAHQVTNVFLKELVVVVKFVVLFPHSLDAVEDCQERLLQSLGMPTSPVISAVFCT